MSGSLRQQVRSGYRLHAGHPCQQIQLQRVGPQAPSAVDFLQADGIALQLQNHSCDPLDVLPQIAANTTVDVVRPDRQQITSGERVEIIELKLRYGHSPSLWARCPVSHVTLSSNDEPPIPKSPVLPLRLRTRRR